jgi:aminoglycoside 2''-phosphotransferase
VIASVKIDREEPSNPRWNAIPPCFVPLSLHKTMLTKPGSGMPEHTEALLQRVQAILPDLVIEQFEINRDGLFNEVAIVNRQLVFRFARDEYSASILQTEMKLLDLVRPRLGINVPTPIRWGADYMVYPFLNGQALTRKLVLASAGTIQNEVAGQMGAFLHRLHTIDVSQAGWEIPATLAPVKRHNWLDLQARLKEKVYPLLVKSQVEWLDDLLSGALDDPAFFEHTPVLIHGDLASYHILYDRQEHAIRGIIDFGVAGMGDPAVDIGGLFNFYGESYIRKIGPSYPALENILPRARFYAQAVELQWVLQGLETGDPSWFTAHLGLARDILG